MRLCGHSQRLSLIVCLVWLAQTAGQPTVSVALFVQLLWLLFTWWQVPASLAGYPHYLIGGLSISSQGERWTWAPFYPGGFQLIFTGSHLLSSFTSHASVTLIILCVNHSELLTFFQTCQALHKSGRRFFFLSGSFNSPGTAGFSACVFLC